MKLVPLVLIAGALLLVGSFTYVTVAMPAGSDAAGLSRASGTQPDTLTLIVSNDGAKAGDATLRLSTAAGRELDARILHLPEGETRVGWALPPAAYSLVLQTSTLQGGADVDLAACKDHVATQRMSITFDSLGGSIRVPREECVHVDAPTAASTRAPIVTRYQETQHIDAWSTCGSHCTLTYMPHGRGGIAFSVPEGATHVIVKATWSASVPTNAQLKLFEDRVDGSRVKEPRSVEGTTGVQLEWSNPMPGQHEAFAGATENGTVIDQDVNLEVLVYS